MKAIRKRIILICVLILLASLYVIYRLSYIQLYKSAQYKAMAMSQSTMDTFVTPSRGEIRDRNGNTLAADEYAGDLYAEVNIIKDKSMPSDYTETFAAKVSSISGIPQKNILDAINQKGAVEVLLKKKVPSDTIDKLKKANIEGLTIIDNQMRKYPYNDFLSQVLGFTGTDNQGLNGIESTFNKYLYGVPGRIVSQVDAAGRIVDDGTQKLYSALKGDNVDLTIDEVIQHFAEDAVNKAYKNYKPASATIIVMNPKTGEVLAMASRPDYDPNKALSTNPSLWNEPAISLNYEPGSVFKTITAAAALDTGVVSPTDRFYCNGYLNIAGININCDAKHGSESFVDGVKNSCNVVFMQVGKKLGKQTLYKYIHAFGFGQPTNIDLPGEEDGIVNPIDKVGPVELATNSFGQGVSVTPIQMITAFSAAINGGYLMKPLIVKNITDDKGKVVKSYSSVIQRQVISKKTSDLLRSMLETVVTEGTGEQAYIPGYSVGGKTGTSQKYEKGQYVASFAGFAPSADPKIAVLVVIDKPNGSSHMGGEIAAPIAKDVLYNTLQYLGVKPVYTDKDKQKASFTMPDVRNLTLTDAEYRLSMLNLKYKVTGKGKVVYSQDPKPGTMIYNGSNITLFIK